MANFWKHVNKIIKEADIVIEVLDARMVDKSRNVEIEEKVDRAGKKLLFVINKADLVGEENLGRWKRILKPCIFISSAEKKGTTILKKKILEMSRGKEVTVGILGYPNVGKSSMINALSGRGSARTSSWSGFTKRVQKIKVDSKIMLLDSPGVFPYKEKDPYKHSLTGAIDFSQLKDPETVAEKFIIDHKEMVKKFYKLDDALDDAEEILEALAFHMKFLLKGKRADIERTARALMKDWQSGKLKN